MLQHSKTMLLLMISALLFVTLDQTLLARGGGGMRGGGEGFREGDRGGYGYYNRGGAARAWENRGLYWDSQGNEIYTPPPAYNYPYSYPYDNSSYYPDYDQYNSPEYNQQPSDPEEATFPYHPV